MGKAVALFLVIACPASAQEVGECESFRVNARNVDWTDPTRTYAGGTVRFVSLDVGEPACCGAYLMVTLPSPEDPGDICYLIGNVEGSGYLRLSLSDARASYDPRTGLTVRVPAAAYAPYRESPMLIEVTVNQQTGVVTARNEGF